MKILVVEDQIKVARYLADGLGQSGYGVEIAENGTDAIHLIQTGPYDLVLLDINLPDCSGFDVLRTIRLHSELPILLLTARNHIDDKVKGLELGADDYLAKPFQYPELLARVRALLRRRHLPTGHDILTVADLTLDPIRHRATRAGSPIDLTSKEFQLLALLMERQGEVLTRTQIASLVWDINFESETNVVEVAIHRLRRRVDGHASRKLIQTIRGVGYVLDTERR